MFLIHSVSSVKSVACVVCAYKTSIVFADQFPNHCGIFIVLSPMALIIIVRVEHKFIRFCIPHKKINPNCYFFVFKKFVEHELNFVGVLGWGSAFYRGVIALPTETTGCSS